MIRSMAGPLPWRGNRDSCLDYSSVRKVKCSYLKNASSFVLDPSILTPTTRLEKRRSPDPEGGVGSGHETLVLAIWRMQNDCENPVLKKHHTSLLIIAKT